jgi:hypothetical protein
MAVFAVFQGMKCLMRETASGLPHWQNFENNMLCLVNCVKTLLGFQTQETLLKTDLLNGFSDVVLTTNIFQNTLQNSSQNSPTIPKKTLNIFLKKNNNNCGR